MTISSFKDTHSFLSNFHPCVVVYERVEYPSLEHAYVAAKTKSELLRNEVLQKSKPGEVKRLGKKFPKEDWYTDEFRLSVMEYLLLQKFNPETHPILADNLLATGDEDLCEGNTWGDTFWGVCRGEGENNLGKLLMKVREHYRTLR